MEKSRFEELLESLNKGEPIVYEPRSRLEEHLVAIINKQGKKGLGEPRSRAEDLLQIHAEQMAGGAGGASGVAIEVSTEADMDAVLVEENIGKFYKFTGKSTDKYTQDTIYLVQDSENPIFEDEIKDIATEAEMDAVLVEENVGKFFAYVGETTDKYTNNMIYVVQDSDSPIIEGPVAIEGGSTGTAVPNEGAVETIYFNTSLTPEEVDSILNNADVEWREEPTLPGSGMYNVLYAWGGQTITQTFIGLSKIVFSEDDYGYMIMLTNGYGQLPVYISPTLKDGIEDIFGPVFVDESGKNIRGWLFDTLPYFEDFHITNPYNVDYPYSNPLQKEYYDGTPVGLQNEALKQLISITPFDGEPFYKELKGTYEPVTVEVTENGEIDLTTYMDNGGMPIKVNVEVEGGSGGSVSLKALWDHTKTTRNAFYGVNATDLSNYLKYDYTSNVTDMFGMFDGCTNLATIPELDTSNATNMSQMFNGCTSLTNVPDLDTSNVTNMFSMFYGCTSLTNVPDLNTSNVTVMNNMFDGCTNLVTAPELDTSNVTKMNYMFRDCTNLVTVPKLDMDKCTNSSSIFANCVNLTNVTLLNIRETMYLGSGTSYGQMLTAESLINSAFECINAGSNRKLYIGSTHGDKLNNVYVKFKDPSVTTIPVGEKGDVVLCESTDEGAMTLYAYMALKKWSFSN